MAEQHTSKGAQCVYCNHAPVNHRYEFFNTSVGLFLSDLFSSRRSKRQMPKFAEIFAIGVLRILGFVLEQLGVLTYSDDIEKACGERTRSILREAKKRGIPAQFMRAFGKPLEVCRAYVQPKGYKKPEWFYFDSLPLPPWSARTSPEWIDDKRVFNYQFTKAGLPVAQSLVVTTQSGALRAFRTLGAPIIVKPRSGSRARHTTVNIRTEAELLLAYKKAKQLCHYVLVESYIPGDVYRATCIGKKVVGILELVKPVVIADGQMTIREIFAYYNSHKKHANLTDVVQDAWFFESMAHQGFTMDSVPPAGTRIVLVEHSERHNGGYFVDVTEQVPPENIALIERGAALCGVDIIGFDIISRDLTKPASVEPMTFIEGNTLPFIEIHLTPYEGKVYDTPKAIWDLWF